MIPHHFLKYRSFIDVSALVAKPIFLKLIGHMIESGGG